VCRCLRQAADESPTSWDPAKTSFTGLSEPDHRGFP
jgi:hypothetical protein